MYNLNINTRTHLLKNLTPNGFSSKLCLSNNHRVENASPAHDLSSVLTIPELPIPKLSDLEIPALPDLTEWTGLPTLPLQQPSYISSSLANYALSDALQDIMTGSIPSVTLENRNQGAVTIDFIPVIRPTGAPAPTYNCTNAARVGFGGHNIQSLLSYSDNKNSEPETESSLCSHTTSARGISPAADVPVPPEHLKLGLRMEDILATYAGVNDISYNHHHQGRDCSNTNMNINTTDLHLFSESLNTIKNDPLTSQLGPLNYNTPVEKNRAVLWKRPRFSTQNSGDVNIKTETKPETAVPDATAVANNDNTNSVRNPIINSNTIHHHNHQHNHQHNNAYHATRHVKRFVCSHCGKTFKHLSNLKIHSIIHTDAAHQCTFCKKKFARKSNLVQHIRVHTDERPFRCNFCGGSFKQAHSLKDHIRTHTGEKPYACSFCGKCFKVKHNMVVHRRLHTGERPFSCTLCTKQFVSKSSLNGHTKKNHPLLWFKIKMQQSK